MRVAVIILSVAALAATQTTEQQVKGLVNVMKSMARQLMMQQLFVEERIRSEGASGLKISRLGSGGTRTYFGNVLGGRSVASVHDHSNNIRTVGMGEFIAVLNGVEFRTRHNDYRLNMPHRTEKTFKKSEPVPFPAVPPAVLQKKTINEQIAEMREWFKAWRDQDYSVRDYRKYFKPVLCYLEGAWTKSDSSGKIDEPFFSDRHFIDAKSWFDLQDKIRFTSYTGRKSQLENFAFLPTSIINLRDDGVPQIAQWTYRIMCHPLNRDLSTKQFRVVDDFSSRAPFKRNFEQMSATRGARFQLDPFEREWKKEGGYNYGLLDKLMEEIPGMDNYPADLRDNAGGIESQTLSEKTLNAGYYHRVYKVLKKDAMGIQTRRRGFSDDNLYMAMNTQEKIAGMSMKYCQGRGRGRTCGDVEQKWSYAVPLEIIYLTPLYTWNPYNIEYKGESNSASGATTRANGANGRKGTPYNGINSRIYYKTPSDFFSGNEIKKDKADTSRGNVYVLDKSKTERSVRASGTRIILPNIKDIGILRTRYPIMPLHHDGSPIMRTVEVLKDMVTMPSKMSFMFREKAKVGGGTGTIATPDVTLEMGVAQKDPPGPHRHTVDIDAADIKDMILTGKQIEAYTDLAAGHNHKLLITYNRAVKPPFVVVKCDGGAPTCWDQHGDRMRIQDGN